jgi:hypothetical protein
VTPPSIAPNSYRVPAELVRSGERVRRALGDRRAGPNPGWVAALTGARPKVIHRALGELEGLLPLEEEIRHRHLASGRPNYAQIRAPFDLYMITRILKPDHIVETGVSSGVSSAHFLAALRRNRRGVLHSIDLPTAQRGGVLGASESAVAIPPGRATGWVVPDDLRDGWDLRIGPAQRLLPRLVRELPSIGLFLHDDLHTPEHLTFELKTIRPRLPEGAVVLADNTIWTGRAFPEFARTLGVPALSRGRTDLVGLALPSRPPEL